MTFLNLINSHELSFAQEASIIRSNANLGVHGQGLLNLSGPGDLIEAQRLVLSLFYSIHVREFFRRNSGEFLFCFVVGLYKN